MQCLPEHRSYQESCEQFAPSGGGSDGQMSSRRVHSDKVHPQGWKSGATDQEYFGLVERPPVAVILLDAALPDPRQIRACRGRQMLTSRRYRHPTGPAKPCAEQVRYDMALELGPETRPVGFLLNRMHVAFVLGKKLVAFRLHFRGQLETD